MRERIWINPVTSKIVVHPLESDTDTPLHEENVIYSEKGREICISSSTRENIPDEMRTSWKLLVDVIVELQHMCLEHR